MRRLDTKVFLIRHGVTDWQREQRLLGHRDIALNAEGLAQANAAADALAEIGLAEVISSPLLRAIQTAEIIGRRSGIQHARDPRLIDLRVGRWEGMTYDEITASREYQDFIANPLSMTIPGGESLEEVKRRSVAAIEQSLQDNATGDAIAVITHAGVIRVLLTHYLGAPPANYHRVRVSSGSISVLSFADHSGHPRVLAINWCDHLHTVMRG